MRSIAFLMSFNRLSIRKFLILSTLVFLSSGTYGLIQAWEKLIVPGLSYRMELDDAGPKVIHAFRYSIGSDFIRLGTEIAKGKVFSENPRRGCETLQTLVKNNGAIGGINGDFFPFLGMSVPLGLMIRNGEIMRSPYPSRSFFGWGSLRSEMSQMGWSAKLSFFHATSGEEETISLSGLNQECGQNSVVLNTEAAGYATAKLPNLYVELEMNSTEWVPNRNFEAKVHCLHADKPNLQVKKNVLVLAAKGNQILKLLKLKSEQKVFIQIDTNGINLADIHHAVGGGPTLCRNGTIFVDWKEQGFKPYFAQQKCARTAIGKTVDGDIWLVVVDGKDPDKKNHYFSQGANLRELAQIMLRFGCVDAMNLDGGGSSTFNLFSRTFNRPSDQPDRKIANAILLYGEIPQNKIEGNKIEGPSVIKMGSTAAYCIKNKDGAMLNNSEIYWVATGKGWVDQGGMLHPLQPGTIKLTACVGNSSLEQEIEILAANGPEKREKKRGASSKS